MRFPKQDTRSRILLPLALAGLAASSLVACSGGESAGGGSEQTSAGAEQESSSSDSPVAQWRASAEEVSSDSEDYGAAEKLCASMLPDDVVERLIEFPGERIDSVRASAYGDERVSCGFASFYTDERDRQTAEITVEYDQGALCTSMAGEGNTEAGHYDTEREVWSAPMAGLNDTEVHPMATCPDPDTALKVVLTAEDDTAPGYDLTQPGDFGPDLTVALRESYADWNADAERLLELVGD